MEKENKKYIEGVDMEKIYYINNCATKNKSAIYHAKDGRFISYIHLNKPAKNDKTKTTYTHVVCNNINVAKKVSLNFCDHGGK